MSAPRAIATTLCLLASAYGCSPAAKPSAKTADVDAHAAVDGTTVDEAADAADAAANDSPGATADTDDASTVNDAAVAPDSQADAKDAVDAAADVTLLEVIEAAGSVTPVDCPGCYWKPMAPLPSPRISFGAVWGGGQLYVWGGSWTLNGGNDPDAFPPFTNGWLADGLRWDPQTDTWTKLPEAGLLPIDAPKLTWAGDRLFVCCRPGGKGWPEKSPNGAMYFPGSDSWQPLPKEGSGGAFWNYAATTWTPAGFDEIAQGARRFNLQSGTWSDLPKPPVGNDAADHGNCHGWTGKALVVWHPYLTNLPNGTSGLEWWPATQKYTEFDKLVGQGLDGPKPDMASNCLGIDGAFAVWGSSAGKLPGVLPERTLWLHYAGQPGWQLIVRPAWLTNRQDPQLAWTGKYIVIWSGVGGDPVIADGGAIYDPAAQHWWRVPEGAGAPAARTLAGLVWTGTELLIVGGVDGTNKFTNDYFLAGASLVIP